ncbi:MAG: hypothetical protein GKR94_13585 [Gammaproteobacteria bacterium]|nr:hypothetical protein [Gammaproteobacteria bacterium]
MTANATAQARLALPADLLPQTVRHRKPRLSGGVRLTGFFGKKGVDM